MSRKFKVTLKEKGWTLLAYLREQCPDAPSVKSLKRAIEEKRCTINGRVETFSTHRVSTGDEVEIEIHREKKVELKLHLLWEDEALIAYDKPAGWVSDPKNFDGYLIHRLDKETSGVLLVAKSKPVLDQMIELFRQRQVEKTYWAIVDGVVKEKQGKIFTRLAPKNHFQGQTVYGSAAQGKLAETRWIKLAQAPQVSLLECYPLTGRTHQIRVHLKEIGHPIIGDYQYTKQFKCSYKAPRHLLHALAIAFPHPLSKKKLTLKAPIPPDFLAAFQAFHFKGALYLGRLAK